MRYINSRFTLLYFTLRRRWQLDRSSKKTFPANIGLLRYLFIYLFIYYYGITTMTVG